MKLSLASVVAIAGIASAAPVARAPGVPAICWDVCNNALLEGLRVGWTDPNLCDAHSPFMDYRDSCYTCIVWREELRMAILCGIDSELGRGNEWPLGTIMQFIEPTSCCLTHSTPRQAFAVYSFA